ncbi:MAG: RNA polymerase sigma-70 factor [Bacteroidetes bacterium]|nr:RNA polymerase sigma-70 factor [Bacteroidota bacterium]
MDDQQRLRNGLRKGDKKIFEEVYRLYYSPLCFYCLRYVGDMEEAKEVVQSIFFNLWIKRNEIEISTSVKSYLYKAVQNYCLNQFQQEKIKQKYMIRKANFPRQHSENGELKMEEDELRKVIKSAILKLPEKRREIFELSRFENMKYAQIAEHLTISVKTVEAQMSKSLQYLRKVLKEYMPVILVHWAWFVSGF